MNPVAEMRAYLGKVEARCRAQHWLGPLFHVGVLQQIHTDLEADDQRRAREAYAAEQELLELAKALPVKAAARARRIASRLHDLAETALFCGAFGLLALGYAMTFVAAVRGDNELRTARPVRSVSVRAHPPTRDHTHS